MSSPIAGSPPWQADATARRSETDAERADRNLAELLQELRVAQIGVTILFAGLISLAFSERFARADQLQRWTYTIAVILTVVSVGLLIAPAAAHRMTFSLGVKAEVVRLGHRLFQVGLVALALALAAAVLLVLDVTLGRGMAIAVAAPVLVLLVLLWFVLPLPARRAARAGAARDAGPGP
ncbi:DUF6328 family protein [Pseudonocardia sp.]|uniref:DUF6328 family protein n=1 Tax=Pseudonocardia sp. TaxID=60912 RepID=UPI003D0DB812